LLAILEIQRDTALLTMTIESPTDQASCPTDQTGHQEASQACRKILAENGRTVHGRTRTPDSQRSTKHDGSLPVSTDGLYPAHHRSAAVNGPDVGHGSAVSHVADTKRTTDTHAPTRDIGHGPKLPIFDTLENQRKFLLDQAEKVLPKTEAASLKRDMEQFERRAKAKHLPDSEVSKTYNSAWKLLMAERGATSVSNMQWLAEDVIHQAAHPEDVRQGNNNTCEMASLEFVMYSKNPSVAADMVAQSALSGMYKTKDGKTILADSEPTYESSHYSRANGDRSFASQVFQTTAINVGFAEDGVPYMYQAQHGKVPGNHSERGGIVFDTETGQQVPYYNSDDAYATEAYYGMTGKTDLTIVTSGRPDPRFPNILHANTPAQFNQIMRNLEKNNQFPVIVGVDAQNQPFWSDAYHGGHDPHKRYKYEDGHAIAATGFRDGALPTVSIHNNWYPEDDHRSLSARELFMATRPAKQNLRDLQEEYDKSVAGGKPDYLTALDILRLKAGFRQIGPDELRTELLNNLRGIIGQQGVASTSLPSLQYEWKEISRMIQARGGADPAVDDPELWKRIRHFLDRAHEHQ
jgi:hypothetical protein